jgi:glycosyltransferase involved in cell wall biosynthesis
MIDLTIYLLCYNEEVLLPNTLLHYKARFPNAKYIIIDNESTDRSRDIAIEAGCEIMTWKTDNIANIIKNTELKNNVWKSTPTDWVIIADMDEWIEFTEEDLETEDKLGTTIVQFRAIQIVAESNSLTLDDLDLHSLKHGYYDIWFNKHVCFKRSQIEEINFTRGAHKSNPFPKDKVKYSKKVYPFKHMNFLGFPWYEAKMKARYARTHYNRSLRTSGHYTNNDKVIRANFDKVLSMATLILK